jgi:hypothetical protein
MSAEPIDFGTAPTAPPPEGWTVADVDALPDRDGVRYELVDGVPKVMTPGRGRHQTAARRLANALEATARVAFRIDVDGIYEEVGRAEPGQVLRLDAPFPITLDPAALVR